jgi:FAD-dependent urate hydroxylase
MTYARTALVIGGGIAGPVAALALRRAGIQATIYEAYPASAEGVGGGLSLAPNGLNALALLDLKDIVIGIGVPMAGIVMQSSTGKKLAEFGGGQADDPPMQFVWRPDLYRALHDGAARRGVATEYGKRLVAITEDSAGVTARFADASAATADVLIGADGLRSTVRSAIDPAAPQPRYSGLISFGARMSRTGHPHTNHRMYMTFGKRAFFGYQVEADGSGGWFVNLPQQPPMTMAQARATSPEEWLTRLAEVFAGDRTSAHELIRRTDPSELLIVGPMEDLPTVPTWSRGRTVLIGDSAHAPSSSSGQGASLAIESAIQVARCLRDLPYPQAFATYEELRRARVEKVIAAGARSNNQKAAGPVARVLRDLFLPMAMKLLAKPEKMAWQFDYRIDWDAPVSAAARRPQPTPDSSP